MHQSCIVKRNGLWHLLVIGGKGSKDSWLSSVEALNLTPLFLTGLVDADNKPLKTDFKSWSDLNSPRSNFSITVFKNTVYVFGGFSGQSIKGQPWRPTMAPTLERLQPAVSDSWLKISIQNIPQLASFSWTSTDDGRLFILGGSDGSLLTSDVFEINFTSQNPEVKQLVTDFEFSTGMGHLVYRKEQNELHHVGGINCEGINYSLKIEEGKEMRWKTSKFSQSYVSSQADSELTVWPSVSYN